MNNSVSIDGEDIYPSKIICVGRNYVEHIKELKNKFPTKMVLFNKPNSSISKIIKYFNEECHFETELSFVVKDETLRYVGIGFDFTKRSLQDELKNSGLPWERAKSFDGSAVFTKFVPINFPLKYLEFKLFINNKITQQGKTSLMINSPDEIFREIKTFMSVSNGDVIMTGTPKGVSSYQKNDLFRVTMLVKDKTLIDETWIVK